MSGEQTERDAEAVETEAPETEARETEAVAAIEAGDAAPPTKKRRYLRYAAEIGLVLAIYAGFRVYQLRDAPTGPAPALSATGIDGAALSILPTEEPVLVHFWATWCGVCEAEEDNIHSVADGHRVITVASQSGTPGAVSAYLADHELAFPVVNDPRGSIAQAWGVRAFPTSFIVDPDGQIRHVEVGYTSTLGLRARLWLAGL